MNICVYGGGSWGSALAHLLAWAGHESALLLRDEGQAASINKHHENRRYLPGLALHPGVKATSNPAVLEAAELWVLAVPCQSQRAALEQVRHFLRPETVLVNASKGLELGSLKRMSQVAEEALGSDGQDIQNRYAVLSGPSFAKEVLECKPTAVVLAVRDEALGAKLRAVFAAPWFRSYSSQDVTGVELGGAVKNIIAIAAGACDGLNFGHNARAALVTRGLAEVTRLGVALGANPATFMGLSGLGDLMLTCTGDLSRNRQVGLRLGQGQSLSQIMAEMNSVAEGVKTTEAVHSLAQKLNVDMPITAAMYNVLQSKLAPTDAVSGLMSRSLKDE